MEVILNVYKSTEPINQFNLYIGDDEYIYVAPDIITTLNRDTATVARVSEYKHTYTKATVDESIDFIKWVFMNNIQDNFKLVYTLLGEDFYVTPYIGDDIYCKIHINLEPKLELIPVIKDPLDLLNDIDVTFTDREITIRELLDTLYKNKHKFTKTVNGYCVNVIVNGEIYEYMFNINDKSITPKIVKLKRTGKRLNKYEMVKAINEIIPWSSFSGTVGYSDGYVFKINTKTLDMNIDYA